ncbi:hypothetical protein Q7P37_007712 [Cladosporium fusiforme]
MSAIARPATILAGLAVTGAATTYTVRNSAAPFGSPALAASETDSVGRPVVPKAKLPSEFFHLTTKSGISLRN